MRTETVTYNIFTFEELSKEVQAKVLDNYRSILVDIDYWFEVITEEWKEDLEEYGFMEPEIWFGLHAQGSGACFDCGWIDITKLLNKLKGSDGYDGVTLVARKEALQDLISSIKITSNSLSNHYNHEHTRQVELEIDPCVDDEKHPHIESALIEFQEDVEYFRKELCSEIYTALDDYYDYLTSDEAIKESFMLNETEFTEDGKIYR